MSQTPIKIASIALSAERLLEIQQRMNKLPPKTLEGILQVSGDRSDLLLHIAALEQEIDVRKRYSHFCCLAHADKALAEKRATGIGPWENTGISTAQIIDPAPTAPL